VNDLNPKIEDEDDDVKDDIARVFYFVGTGMGSVLEIVDCDRCDKKSVDWARVYIHKSEQEHRPRGPRVTYLPALEIRARISVRASLAYGSSVKCQIRKHYFRLASSNRGPNDTHTHSTRVHVSGVVCGWTVSGSQPRCKARHSTLITHNIEG
jgi:hypothetical protein